MKSLIQIIPFFALIPLVAAAASPPDQAWERRIITRAPTLENGSPCTSSSQCISNSCQSKVCKNLVLLNGDCYKQNMCESQNCVDGKCVKTGLLALNSVCKTSSVCASGLCSSSRCSKIQGIGGSCTKNLGCTSGLCSNSKCINAEKWNLVENIQGNSFFDHFTYWTDPDPTHGIVSYQSKASSTSRGLTYTDGYGNAIIKVDDTSKLSEGVNRKSVRLMSRNTYSTGLSIIDVNQIPYGTCSGVWPAWWMYGPNWPNSGELDIIEQIENASNNKMSLHTSQGCTLTSSSSSNPYSGKLVSTDCYAYSSTYGCSIDDSGNKGPSYGSAFKKNGGGVWATRFISSGISIWWWPRNQVPQDIKNGIPMPLTWGTPSFNVASKSCNVNKYFKNMQFVINIALAGDWAGNVFPSSSCGGTVQAAVANPSNFRNAVWNISSINFYSL